MTPRQRGRTVSAIAWVVIGLGAILILLVLVTVASQLPEIKRYLKIKGM